jgi:2-C-methyl-D-erythritol 4-phosphate cytidylyltransferase
VVVIEGEETNIKITRPVDLLIAEQYLAQRSCE